LLKTQASAFNHLYTENETLRKELNYLRNSCANVGKLSTTNPGPTTLGPTLRPFKHGNPFEEHPIGEPLEVDRYIDMVTREMTPQVTPQVADDELVARRGPFVDVTTLKKKEREVYEQYQRFQKLSIHVFDDRELVTAATIAGVAQEHYPLMELEDAMSSIQRFMIYDCNINQDEDSINMSETSYEQRVSQAEVNFGIPFDVFMRLARLDNSQLEQSQELQGDTLILTQLHQALLNEQENFLNEKRETFSNILGMVSAVVLCMNAITLGLSADHPHKDLWFFIKVASRRSTSSRLW